MVKKGFVNKRLMTWRVTKRNYVKMLLHKAPSFQILTIQQIRDGQLSLHSYVKQPRHSYLKEIVIIKILDKKGVSCIYQIAFRTEY